jgi:hypothetical protein
MITLSPALTYEAVDLSRMSKGDLAQRPRPLSSWPTANIKISDVHQQTCIASWKRDTSSVHQISNRMSECAWDGITMGFRYMLADVISLPQDDPHVIEKVIEFSTLYEVLHSGRVPVGCGKYPATSPKPPGWSESVGHQPSKWVFKTSCHPGELIISKLVMPYVTLIIFVNLLHRTGLWPRRNTIEQYFTKRPRMVGQAGRHRWRAQTPHLR